MKNLKFILILIVAIIETLAINAANNSKDPRESAGWIGLGLQIFTLGIIPNFISYILVYIPSLLLGLKQTDVIKITESPYYMFLFGTVAFFFYWALFALIGKIYREFKSAIAKPK